MVQIARRDLAPEQARDLNLTGRRGQDVLAANHEIDALIEIVDHNRELIGPVSISCLLYTSDAAAERSSVDLGGRRII